MTALLDPIFARGPINTTAPPPPDPVEPATPLSFSISGNGERADVVVIGAGAGGSVAARHLAEAGFKVVCLEQGGWENAADFPGDKLEWELVADAQFSPNPNTRKHPADYPLEVTRSPITPVMYNAVGGSTVHFCAQWVRLRPQDYKLRTLPRDSRRLAHLLRGDEAVLRADRPGDADLRHDRRPQLPARPAAAPAAAPDRCDRASGRRGHERAQLALVAGRARDPLGGGGQPRRLRAHRRVHVGLPQGAKSSTDTTMWPQALAHGAKLVTGARVREITTNGNGLATGANLRSPRRARAAPGGERRRRRRERRRHRAPAPAVRRKATGSPTRPGSWASASCCTRT